MQNLTKLGRNYEQMVLRNNTTFSSGWTNKMAARADPLFWLAYFQKSSLWKYWAEFNQTGSIVIRLIYVCVKSWTFKTYLTS